MRTTSFTVRSDDDVAALVLETRLFARLVGLGAPDCERVTTSVAELASNIVKYAGRGRVTLREIEDGPRRGVVVEARDRGPGIVSVEDALTDRHSSSGTLGLGLPGARRLMDDLQIETTVGRGTTVRAVKWTR